MASLAQAAAADRPPPDDPAQARRRARRRGVVADPLPLDTWMSYNPMRGEAAAEKTSVWVAYDDAAIYFAFRCLDTQPDRIRTNISRRDNAFNDDWVGVEPRFQPCGTTGVSPLREPERHSDGRAAERQQRRRLRAGLGVAERGPRRRRRMVGGDSRADRKHPLPERHRRAHGRAVLAPPEPHRRVDLVAGDAVGQMGVRRRTRRSSFDQLQSRRLLEVIPSSTFSTNQVRRDELGWKCDARARGFRRQREVRHHVGRHARRHGQPRLQPGRERCSSKSK